MTYGWFIVSDKNDDVKYAKLSKRSAEGEEYVVDGECKEGELF